MCQVVVRRVVEFVAPETAARAVPGPLRFASLLLNTMIGSTIEPVDGSYDAVISACQKGPRFGMFGVFGGCARCKILKPIRAGQSALPAPAPSQYSFGAAIAALRTEWNLALDAWNRRARMVSALQCQ